MTNEIFKEFGNNPIALCQSWLDEARESEINDPEAICLATATKDGIPSNRWVLIKAIDERGFKFHTNEGSQKGRELAENPNAAMTFYWKSLRRQIRIVGTVEQATQDEADEYFNTRPIERKIGAWASNQSQPFHKWEDLESRIQHYTDEFASADNIPRPDYWKGYRLTPSSMEFWIASKARLHKRFVYTKTDGGSWGATWLCP